MTLTLERLKQVLHYDPETGLFTNLVRRGRVGIGAVIGADEPEYDDYVRLIVDGKNYVGHRLAWFYMKGVWPSKFLDHRDTNKRNNRFANLREATRQQNGMNIGLKSHNTSGLKGVSFWKKTGKWKAQLQVNGVKVHLGYHETKEAAYAAFLAGAERYHAEFARAA